MGSAGGGSQKKRTAAVGKESAETQECESCQQRGQGGEELCAVSGSAGCYEPKFMCDRQCRKEGFKFCDIAAIMVEDDGKPHT